MRLLHLMNYKPLGTRAMDHFILEYAKQGAERGWDVSFSFTGDAPKELAHLKWARYDITRLRDCGSRIVTDPPDVIQTSFHSAFEDGILDFKRVWGIARLAIIDHSSGEGPSPRSWLTPLRRWRGRRVGKIVDAITCVSEFNARRAVERVFLPVVKVHVVPNGIDLSRFTFSERMPRRRINVAYAGQLIAEKGVRTLLEAAALLRDEPVDFRIAGAGPLRGELEAIAVKQTLANVQFLGHVPDVAVLYQAADIVVVPSLWAEAFGLVAIEAMACGAVVVASDAGALPEVVGDAGVILPKGNAAALAMTVKALLGDEVQRRQLATAGRRRVEGHYQLQDCVRRHLDIVGSLK